MLGSIILQSETVIDLCIQKKISNTSFYLPNHRLLWETVLAMHERGKLVDAITLGEEFTRLEIEADIGGAGFMDALVDTVPTVAHVEHYIGIMKQKATARKLIEHSSQIIEKCYDGEEEDIEQVVSYGQQGLFEIVETEEQKARKVPELVKETMVGIEKSYHNNTLTLGLSTGYADLDRQTLGFQDSDMIVLGARPSMGKTSLALNIGERVAMGETSDKKPRMTLVFSLEMSVDALMRRMICSRARVSSHKLASGFLSAQNYGQLCQSAGDLMNCQMLIDETARMDMMDLRSRARSLKRRFNIEFIIVDYLQLLKYKQYSRDGRQTEISEISSSLKAMAKELNVPVLVLSQLNRSPDKRDRLAVPKLSDLRDSGSIEQDADLVMLLRRPSMYPSDPEHDDKRLAIVDVAKARNGPTGEIKLNFEKEFMTFEDRAAEFVEGGDMFHEGGEVF